MGLKCPRFRCNPLIMKVSFFLGRSGSSAGVGLPCRIRFVNFSEDGSYSTPPLGSTSFCTSTFTGLSQTMAVSEGFFGSEPSGEETEPVSKAVGAYNVGMTSDEPIHQIILQLNGNKVFRPRAQERQGWFSNYGEVRNKNDV